MKTAQAKASDIINNAAYSFSAKAYANCIGFADYVAAEFWKSFGEHDQSQIQQEVYIILSDLGFTPLERFQ